MIDFAVGVDVLKAAWLLDHRRARLLRFRVHPWLGGWASATSRKTTELLQVVLRTHVPQIAATCCPASFFAHTTAKSRAWSVPLSRA